MFAQVSSVSDQTWVHSPKRSKANLLTPGCGEESVAFIAGAKQGVQVANAQKT